MELTVETLAKLNSLTKYPSIPTYHQLGERGRLTEALNVAVPPDEGVYVTEKVDGTNSRLCLFPDGDFLVGSREEFLYARGDRILNPAQQILQTVLPLRERFRPHEGSALTVFYLETYGGKVTGASKQYTEDREKTAARLFDVQVFDAETLAGMLEQPQEAIALWRESGSGTFLHQEELTEFAAALGLEPVPFLLEVRAAEFPRGVAETLAWLEETLPGSRAALDETGFRGAEGVVVRTGNRGAIAKLRFEDYRRTIGKDRRERRS